MLASVVSALALCTCGQAPQEAPSRFAIVPDKVLHTLGGFSIDLAVDFQALDRKLVDACIPDALGCTRDLLKTARVGVITLAGDSWEGRVTGLDGTQTRECLAKLAPLLGFELQPLGTGFKLELPGNPLEVAWQDGDVVVRQAGHVGRDGEPPVVINDLLSSVPRTAKAWLVSSGFPQFKIKSAVAYLETNADTLVFTAIAESLEQGAARPWIEGIVHGFKTAASAKGAQVDDRWFVIDSTPVQAKLIATIPSATLVRR